MELQAEFIKDIKNNYMVLQSKGEKDDSFALKMLARNNIQGLLKLEVKMIDNQKYYYYDVTSKRSLSEILEKSLINYGQIKKIYDHIFGLPDILKEYLIDENNILELFEEKIDYVVDACDTVMVKKLLIKICLEKNINIISCMGMGNKLDPSKIKIMDIRKTSYDPIAKVIRKYVKDLKTNKKIMVVCSDEKNISLNSKTISSNAFVPGILCTSYIINDIIKR